METDQARAKVLAGTPFAVDIPVTLVAGTLAGGATMLGVAAGEVYSTPVTVTRTAGTTTAVTVDVDLSTQPTLPRGHTGYEFARVSSGLPATILPGTTSTPTAPGKPTGLTATASGSTQIDLSWTAPAIDGGSAITGYKIEVSTDGTAWTDRVADTGSTDTSYSHTGLAAGDTRHYRVSAINDAGTSEPSDAVSTNTETTTTPDCTLNPGDLWCGAVTVGTFGTVGYGFVDAGTGTGALSDKGFSVGTNSYTIDDVWVGSGNNVGVLHFSLTSALTAADQAKLVLHVGSAEFAFSATGPSSTHGYRWVDTGLDWSSTSSVTLRLRDATTNAAPSFTSSETFNPAENQTAVGTVEASDSDTGDEITGYVLSGGADQALFAIGSTSGVLTFQAAPNYENPQDADTDNAYEVTVQATGGTEGRVLTETQTITVAVTNADEGQTGTVTIDDTAPMVDDALTASTADVADPDGLPDPFAPAWQWYRTPAGGAEAEISGAASVTYTVVEADLGAALTAKASWTDVGAFANTLASAPTIAVTAAATTVTIAADQEAFTAALDDVTFTLTRTEDLAAALDVAVALTQDRTLLASADLAQTVTFGAGEATAKLIIDSYKFASHTVTEEEATLTATVQDGTGYEPGSPNTVSTRIVVADPAVTAWIDATAYTFAEDATGNDATIAVILRTATGVPVPNRTISLSLSTRPISGQAESRVDYEPFAR